MKRILTIGICALTMGCNNTPKTFFDQYEETFTPVKLGDGSLSRDSVQWNNAFVEETQELYYTKSHATGASIHKFDLEDGVFVDRGKVNLQENAILSDVHIAQHGNMMLFASTMLENNNDTIGDWNIWNAIRQKGIWQKPELYFSRPMSENEFYPTLTKSGNLYFTITPHGSQNGDIYVAEFVDGKYDEPKPLPQTINSLANEGDAFVAPDESYMLFASFDREQSLGKSDLYISLRNAEGDWLPPVWLGEEINSDGYDGSPFVTMDGKFLIFTSSRDSSDENTFFNHYIVRFDVEKYRKDALSLKNYLSNIGSEPQRFALGTISGMTIEYGASLSLMGNEFYFSRAAPDFSLRTIMRSVFENGKFQKPTEVWTDTFVHDASDVQISQDGQSMLFKMNGQIPDDSLRTDGNIWQSHRVNGDWQLPEILTASINSQLGEYYPMPTNSGNLYFSRQQKKTSYDIYMSEFADGKFSDAVRLPDHINTELLESDAYVSPDESYMIFVRMDAADGLGVSDLYISFNEDGVWSHPINMMKINSKGVDGSPYVTPDGKYLFFTSNRGSSTPDKFDGHLDIYAVRFNVKDWS